MTEIPKFTLPLRWKYAAWIYLLITLISGTLLRYQWTGSSVPLFNSQFLLHGHSHLALLGWAFVAIFGGMFQTSGYTNTSIKTVLFEGFFHVIIIGMFVAFVLQGYAFWSILLSMSHIILTFVLIVIYWRKVRPLIPDNPRSWLDISLFWMVVSTIGPWMLSAGTMMGPDWINFWVGYYLTLTFNGWLTFATIGLLIWKYDFSIPVWVRDTMALGVLPAFFARSHELFNLPVLDWLGWIGSILFGGGFLAAGIYLILHHRKVASPKIFVTRIFFYSMITASILTGLFTIIGGYPALSGHFFEIRMLVIGFVHLQLLGFVSAALILMYFNCKPLGSALFLAGSWIMIGLLLIAGIFQFWGIVLFWPLQWMMTGCGLTAILGAVVIEWKADDAD